MGGGGESRCSSDYRSPPPQTAFYLSNQNHRMLTRSVNATNPPFIHLPTIPGSLPAAAPTTTSSSREGAHIARLNGQPSSPPSADQKIPATVLLRTNAAVASMVVYMAKELGRKAAAAWNIPALVAVKTR